MLLAYTSLVLPNNLLNSQPPCEERLLAVSKNIGTKKTLNKDNQGSNHAKADLNAGALAKLGEEFQRKLQSRDDRIQDLERQLGQVTRTLKLERQMAEKMKQSRTTDDFHPIIDRADDSLRPLRVTVAHHPRTDLLGSFTLPSMYLLAITYRYGWEMEILSYEGSFGQRWLEKAFAKGSKLGGGGYGSGFQDSNYRDDYNPAALNAQAYANLGFFHEQPFPAANESEWTEVRPLPAPGSDSLHKACRKNPIIKQNGHVTCRLVVPRSADTGLLLKHIQAHGTLEDYFNPDFCKILRDRFFQANAHRITHFGANTNSTNVAIHVRRGEINKEAFPDRWIEQSVYAKIARHVCTTHPNAHIHVYSSGRNEEGWATLEKVKDTCASVEFHLDEYEFDAWAHFVAADTLITSRSTFSYVPALIARGHVIAPEWGHAPLKFWSSFNEKGELKPPKINLADL